MNKRKRRNQHCIYQRSCYKHGTICVVCFSPQPFARYAHCYIHMYINANEYMKTKTHITVTEYFRINASKYDSKRSLALRQKDTFTRMYVCVCV